VNTGSCREVLSYLATAKLWNKALSYEENPENVLEESVRRYSYYRNIYF
jgi:hypothetical protein